MIKRARLFDLIRKLIAIDSQNPPGNEAKIAAFVAGHLRRMGLKPELVEFAPRRTNVICRLGNGGRELLLTPHLDTVPAGKNWFHDPFTASKKNGRLYGLGATDCKGNLACSLEALNSLVEDRARLDYRLTFCATADEESGSRFGLESLLAKGVFKPDAAVVLDGEDFDIIVAQKGLLHLKLVLRGKRAHGAYPWLGENAVEAAAEIISSLAKHKFAYRRSPYLHAPTVNTGTIRGGDKVNIVADWCEIEFDFRFLPGMGHEPLVAELKRQAKRSAKQFEIEIEGLQPPYEIRRDHPLVVSLAGAMRSQGMRPRITGSEGATVISFFQQAGIPSVATGFGTGGCCHVADEYVETGNLWAGARVIEDFLKNFSFKP